MAVTVAYQRTCARVLTHSISYLILEQHTQLFQVLKMMKEYVLSINVFEVSLTFHLLSRRIRSDPRSANMHPVDRILTQDIRNNDFVRLKSVQSIKLKRFYSERPRRFGVQIRELFL